jgi:hypothetical protein
MLPPITDRAAFQAEIDALREREKEHKRAGDALAAARRRLPMVELDAWLPLIGPDGPVSLRLRPRGGVGGLAGRLAAAVGTDERPHPYRLNGRPIAQWPRLEAGFSDDLTGAA